MTPQEIAYLRAKAEANGYNADDLLKVINYESSGRPGIWGGKGNNYFGLIQFGPAERKQFGVDTAHPSATNQIDAAMKFLATRGFKSGMGLQDLYSTVLAGSPGHYNRSDGAGTVAQHVANMTGGKPASPMASIPYASNEATAVPPVIGLRSAAMGMEPEAAPQPTIGDLLAQLNTNKSSPSGLLGDQQQQLNIESQKARALHRQAHEAAMRGLLGGNI